MTGCFAPVVAVMSSARRSIVCLANQAKASASTCCAGTPYASVVSTIVAGHLLAMACISAPLFAARGWRMASNVIGDCPSAELKQRRLHIFGALVTVEF